MGPSLNSLARRALASAQNDDFHGCEDAVKELWAYCGSGHPQAAARRLAKADLLHELLRRASEHAQQGDQDQTDNYRNLACRIFGREELFVAQEELRLCLTVQQPPATPDYAKPVRHGFALC